MHKVSSWGDPPHIDMSTLNAGNKSEIKFWILHTSTCMRYFPWVYFTVQTFRRMSLVQVWISGTEVKQHMALEVFQMTILVLATFLLVCLMAQIRGGQPTTPGRMRPVSNSCAARHALGGRKYYGWILWVPLLGFWVQPATKFTTHFRTTVVKRLPTTGPDD